MDNEQLTALIQAGEEVKENMLALYQQNKGFIHTLARRYSGGAEMEDLLQEGYIALHEAVEQYQESRGMSFISYAAFYIHRRMRACVDNSRGVHIPFGMDDKIRQYKRVRRQYEAAYGVEPSDKEIQAFFAISGQELEQIKKAVQMGRIRSLDAPVDTGDGEVSMMELIPDKGDLERATIERIDRENMKRELWLVVDQLPGDLPRVMRLRYQEGLTLEETGKSLGVKSSSVRDLQAKAFRLMRTERRGAKLRRYCEEYLNAVTVPHVGIRSFHATWTSEVEREAIKRYEKSRRISRPDSGEGDQKSVPDQEPEGAHFRAFDLPSERGAGVSTVTSKMSLVEEEKLSLVCH